MGKGHAGFGNGPRKLIGQSMRSPHAFTRIEIADNGGISTTAFIAPDFVEPLALDNLPLTLGNGTFRLTLPARCPN